MRRRNKDTSKMLLTVSSFGESFRRTCKFGGSIFNDTGDTSEDRDYFLTTVAGSVRIGRTTKNELPFPSTDSTQIRP